MTQPSVPTVYINQRVDDPLIAAIAGRAVAELTLAAHKAAAHIASPEVFAVEADHHEEQLFLKLLNGLAVEKRTQIAGKGLAFMRLDEAARAAVIGSLAGADVRNGISVETAARSIALDFPKAAAMRPVPSGGVRTPASQNTGDMHTRDAPSSTTQPLEILEFRLLRIRCNDETDGAGDDDIAVSAVLTDPNMKVTKSQVGDLGEFEEGRDWTLPTPICFGSFDMKAGVAWPRRYSAVVFITELDWGGFPAWLDELVVSIKTKLKDLVEKAVAKFLEELGPVGEWLGKAAAWLVGEVFGGIIDLIKDWVDDDILDPIKFDVEFPAADARWLGQPDSTAFAVEGGAGGHGGGYHVWCEWRLTTRGAAQTPPQLVTGPLEDIATDLNGVACLHGGAEVTAVGVPAVFALRADRCVWTCEPAAAMESQWRSLGGALRSGPAAAVDAGGHPTVFARGDDDAVWFRRRDGEWTDWATIGGEIRSAPAATLNAKNQLVLFARGTNDALWYAWYEQMWSGWMSLGGDLTSGPAALRTADNRVVVAARGRNGAIWQRWFDNGWSDWTSVGGQASSAPALALSRDGNAMLFCRGGDGAIWSVCHDGKAWQAWTTLGGQSISGPAAMRGANGSPMVFCRGADNLIYESHEDDTWTPWRSIGKP